MNILIGSIPLGFKGGVPAAECPFQEALKKNKDIRVRIFHFGRKKEAESVIQKVFGRFIDIILYVSYLINFKPDIVHLNSAFDERALLRDVWYAIFSRLFHQPLFIKYHGSLAYLLNNPSPFWRLLIAICRKYSTGIGALSTEEKINFIKAGYKEKRVFVVKNCVNWQMFSREKTVSADIPEILFISRFLPTKGLLDVIRATRYVIDSGRTVKLVCVGDGENMAEAKILVRELYLQNNVTFTGLIPEEKTIPYYINSTLLVLPTHHEEGFSMVIFQAVAAGLPIITTKIRAAADYLKEPDNCLWVEPRNSKMIAQKIIYLLERPELCDFMSSNNRELAKQFSADKIAKEYLEIYRKLLRG